MIFNESEFDKLQKLKCFLRYDFALISTPKFKGQTKSKWFFQAYISYKKRTKEFNFTTMRLAFVRFLEEIEDIKDISKLTDL